MKPKFALLAELGPKGTQIGLSFNVTIQTNALEMNL